MQTALALFSPFGFIGLSRPKIDTTHDPSDDLYRYGFSLDLTTECYFYTYDWGYGFNFRFFGFGFEVNRYGF
jgi:hypothetical protein